MGAATSSQTRQPITVFIEMVNDELMNVFVNVASSTGAPSAVRKTIPKTAKKPSQVQ